MKMFITLNLGDEFASLAKKTFDELGYLAVVELLIEAHEKAALERYQPPLMLAELYIKANNVDKALDWLEKGYEIHGPDMPYIATGIYPYAPLYGNPRFNAILEKMNLPSPGD